MIAAYHRLATDFELHIMVDRERYGLGWAHKEGLRRTQGDLIAFTDDCLPPPEWLARPAGRPDTADDRRRLLPRRRRGLGAERPPRNASHAVRLCPRCRSSICGSPGGSARICAGTSGRGKGIAHLHRSIQHRRLWVRLQPSRLWDNDWLLVQRVLAIVVDG